MRKKHPYYDSDKKKRTEEFAMKAISICFVGMLIKQLVKISIKL